MQSALNLGDEKTNLMTAEELREITISKEALFQKQKDGVIDSLMSSMIRQATESGATSYTASLHPQFDAKLLASVTEKFESLGFKVVTEAKTVENVGNTISLTISWE